MTSPVSQKITAKSAPYAKTPRSANSASRRSSTWSAKSRSDARKEASAVLAADAAAAAAPGNAAAAATAATVAAATRPRRARGTEPRARVARDRSSVRVPRSGVSFGASRELFARKRATGAPKPTLLDRASRPGRAASPARRVGAAPKNPRPSRSPRALATARGNGPARVPRHRGPRRVGARHADSGRAAGVADAIAPHDTLFFHASPPTSALSTREATTMSRARLRVGQPTRDDRSTARADGWLGVSSRATRGVRRALVELSSSSRKKT